MRRMRLRDDITLTKEMTEGTVLYLSPHYRQLAASGVADEEELAAKTESVTGLLD